MTFEQYCITGARQFLQTALVIDDRAELGSESADSDEPKVAVRAESTSIRRRSKLADAMVPREASAPAYQQDAGEAGADATPLAEPADSVAEPGQGGMNKVPAAVVPDGKTGGSDASAAHLDAKALTDAFLAAEVICGVHKPTTGDESIALAVKAAKRADIVVVDWYLENHSSAKAKAIITGVLKSDVQEHGRLRLIAIYTSEPGRAEVAKDLQAALEREDLLKGCLSLEGTTLCSSDTRICIFNKEGTRQAMDLLPVPEAELPEHLLREFAKLTDGLLANFAVSAVAAVRRGAHHVLARFRNKLDGVYLAHRISLKNPEEAEDMALERIAIELSSLVENADVPGRTLRTPVIDAWLDDRDGRGQVFKNTTARLPLPLMKELVQGGADRLKNKAGQEQTERPGAPQKPITNKTILDVFYPDEGAARIAAREFTRLTSYKREVGRVRLDEFKPRLTLGALLKVRRDLGDTRLYDEIEGHFLLCVQPRCDSVRLKGPRAFPFQQAKYDPNQFNIIVEGEGADGYLHLEAKPMGTIMLRFDPRENDAIFARKDGDSYLFTDERGRVFEWIGDLDDMKAQRFASDIGASMHRVGVDDFEWLRLGASGNIKPEAPQAPAAERVDSEPRRED
jgi:hypothetical protein